MAFDIHQAVTARIIDTLEAGAAGTWTCPWHRAGGSGLPTNALTGRAYRGINILSLWCTEQMYSFGDSRWATYRQWAELGAQVRKGERSTLVVFYKTYDRPGEDGEDETRFVARASYAFNASQVDGAPAPDLVHKPGYVPHGAMDDLASRTRADIRIGGETACYVPSQDHIRMPDRDRFRSEHGWSATLATNSRTGLGRRLGSAGISRPGSGRRPTRPRSSSRNSGVPSSVRAWAWRASPTRSTRATSLRG